MTNSLTEGNPTKVLLNFSIPMLLSVIFQQFYNITDSIIAGKFIGPDALAAVGASYPVTMIFLAFATGLSMGTTVVISKFFGGKKFKEIKIAAKTALIAMLACAILLTLIGLFTFGQTLVLLQTPDKIFDSSCIYLKIYILGLIFLFLYNGANAIFTALGDSKTPLMFLIASSLGNIVLDILFVAVFNMGVAGVAWATFIAQGFASVFACIFVLKRMEKLDNESYKSNFSFHILKQILYISIPSIAQQGFISVGNMFIQSLVNSFGADVITGYAAAIKLNTFALTCFATVSNSISSYVAQNLGAGKLDRVKQGIKSAIFMCLGLCLPFIIAYCCFSEAMINLFLNQSNPEIIYAGIMFLRIASPFYLVVSLKIIIDGALRGAGVMFAFTVSTVSDYIIRIIFAYILSGFFMSTGIWLSWPVSWFIGMIISFLFFRTGKWKNGFSAQA